MIIYKIKAYKKPDGFILPKVKISNIFVDDNIMLASAIINYSYEINGCIDFHGYNGHSIMGITDTIHLYSYDEFYLNDRILIRFENKKEKEIYLRKQKLKRILWET